MRGLNRYSTGAVALSVMLLLTGLLAEAHSYGGRSEGAVMGHLLKGLDLTAQQKQQMRGIMQAHRAALLAGRVAVLQARQNLVGVAAGGTFDADKVQAAYSALAAAQGSMTLLRAQIFSEMMPVLTPDQQTMVKGRIAKITSRMQSTIDRLQSKLGSLPANGGGP
jgi:Spy/CpxP family protein refolding chaperone